MTDLTALTAPIRAREEAATKGPWATEPVECGRFAVIESRVFSARGSHILLSPIDGEAGQAKTADATFIAAARTDVPRLLQALDGVLAQCSATDTETTEALQADLIDRIRAAVVAALGEEV